MSTISKMKREPALVVFDCAPVMMDVSPIMPAHENVTQRAFPQLSKVLVSSVPLLVIAGLVYAGLFIKPKPVGAPIPPATFERGDAFYGLAALSASTIWAGGTDGKVVRTDDGGNTWTRQTTPTHHTIQDIAAWDEMRAVAVGNRGVAIFTLDGGTTWKEGKAPVSQVANKLMGVRVLPGGGAWAVGEYGALLKSEDYGASWVRAAPQEDAAWNDIDFLGDTGWIVGEFGRLKRTTDGGRTWTSVNTGVQTSLMGVRFKDAMHGVAVGVAGTVLVSGDGGLSWKSAPSPVREHLFDVEWHDGRWTAVGAKGVVLSASDPMQGWSVAPVSHIDQAWHTQVDAVDGGVVYLTGGTMVALENGKARPLVR